jgi:tyrosine-protein kinase Etk/Wzc
MSAKISDLFSLMNEKEKDDSPSFRDSLNNYLYHWPLFLIGLLVCIFGAFVYIQRSTPEYKLKATIIIKDATKDGDQTKKEDLEEIDLSNTPKVAENEIEVLQSRSFINQVVKNLQLWVTYQKRNGLKKVDLYKGSPVKFQLIQQTDSISGQTINIIIKDASSFYIKRSDDSLVEFSFNTILNNSFGSWKLEPTKDLLKFQGSEITIILNNQNKVAEKYQKAITADLSDKLASTIELSLSDQVEQRGKDVLNGLINLYNENTVIEKNQITLRTLNFIDKQINDLTGELNLSESAVEGYRSSNGLANISSQSQVYLENAQVNDNKLNEVNVKLNVVDGIEEYLNSPQNAQSVPSTLGIDDASLNASISDLSRLQLEREKLLATTPEANPAFETIDNQIKTLKRSIKESVQNIKSSLLATKRQLESFNSKIESSIQNVPVQERGLVDKTRQQTVKENLYVYLLQKREEISLNYASVVSDARVVDRAYSGGAQTLPGSVVYGLALLFGLILPSGFIYTRNSLNNRITTKKEIEAATGIPVFSELSNSDTSSPLITNKKGDIATGEDFRALRTNLHFLRGKSEKGYTILTTSSISSEGKSFVSSNLGIVLAVSGKKTVILEMDLRKPKVSRTFNLSLSNPGISDYLMDNLSVEKIIQNSKVQPNLDIIGCGHLPSDPSELLQLEEIDALINKLRLKYDYIIIDTPPINLVTDAKILSRLSDVILYVTRQAFTYKSLMPFIKSLKEDPLFADMKIILNGVEKGKYGYNYGDYYYQKIGGSKKKSLKSNIKDFLKRF